MHISTRQCKTTFCTHYKVLAAEERVRVLDWPACSPDLSPIENVWRIWSAKCDNEDPVLLPTLRLVCRKNGDKITPETLHHLVSSVPKRLLSVVKWMATLQSGKCFTVPTFFGMCCRSEWQERMYIYKWHEVDQTKHEIFCVHIVCNEIQVKVNLEITTFFFYLRFPYCPNFFWFGVVYIYIHNKYIQYTHIYCINKNLYFGCD